MPFLKAALLFLGLTAVTHVSTSINLPSPNPQATPQTQIVIRTPRPTHTPRPTRTPKPTATPTQTPKATPVVTPIVKPTSTDKPVTEDYRHQLFDALNSYRAAHGVAALSWNNTLSSYAQSRSDYLNSIGKLDDHVGFEDFINNQDGFNKLGFSSLGENQSFSDPMPSAHDLIFSQYASSPPHDKNQLSTNWSDVGVGVTGEYSDIVFGGSPR